MNIYKKELKTLIKPMIFWSVGLCMLLLIGMIEFTGVENTPDGVNLNDSWINSPVLFCRYSAWSTPM